MNLRVPHPSRLSAKDGLLRSVTSSLFSFLLFSSSLFYANLSALCASALTFLFLFSFFSLSFLCALCVLPSAPSVLPSLFSANSASGVYPDLVGVFSALKPFSSPFLSTFNSQLSTSPIPPNTPPPAKSPTQFVNYSQPRAGLLRLQFLHRFHNRMPHNRHRSRANLVDRILRRMPVRHIVEIKVDDIHRRNTPLRKRKMVVAADIGRFIQENLGIAKFRRGPPHQIHQPFRGFAVGPEVWPASPNQVRQYERLHLLQISAVRQPRRHLPASVPVIRIHPLLVYCLFPVEKRDPHRVLPRLLLPAQQPRDLQHHSRGRPAVIRAHKILQPLRVVVRPQQNNPRFLSRNFHQNIFHRQPPHRRIRRKRIRLHRAAVRLQLRLQIILQLPQRRRSRGPRPEAHLFHHLLVRALPIKPIHLFRRLHILHYRRRIPRHRAHERLLRRSRRHPLRPPRLAPQPHRRHQNQK